MDRLQEFIALLRESPGYMSRQSLAKKAGISRRAVWKHIRKLQQCGYNVESLHGQGYMLTGTTEYPVSWELAKLLDTTFVGKGEMVYRQYAESTQKIAIGLAEKGKVNAVVIAEQQSGGRGRMKRKWLSPKGGIWLSLVIKPAVPTVASTMLPFVAAVAVCDAIREATNLAATLKWPNDVMVVGKKVAGILLDLSAEAKTVNYAVIGVGINANFDASKLKIDRDGRPAVTSLKDELEGRDVNRLQLTKLLLEKIELFYLMLEKNGPPAIIAEWRKRSDMMGKKVSVLQHGQTYYGVAADVNNDGSLRVRTGTAAAGDMNVVSGDVLVIY